MSISCAVSEIPLGYMYGEILAENANFIYLTCIWCSIG